MRPFSLIALCLAPLALGGCDTGECTDMGCFSGLSIEIADGGLSAEGTWTVELAFNGQQISCTRVLPEDSREDCEGGSFRMRGGDTGGPEAIEEININGRSPAEVEIRILHEGVELYADVLEPDYRVWRPNGKGCSPTCRNATVEISVPQP